MSQVSYKGHMKRALTFIEDRLDAIDFAIEVIDSRVPITSADERLSKRMKNKPIIKVYTKSDLSDFKPSAEYVSFNKNSRNQELKTRLTQVCEQITIKWQKKNPLSKPKLRGIVLGLPNVGKSTVINFLANRQAAQVANRPGVTRGETWIKIAPNLEISDLPGIMLPDDTKTTEMWKLKALSLVNFLPDEATDVTYELLCYLYNHYRNYFITWLGETINPCEQYEQTIEALSLKWNFLLSGKRTDTNRCEKHILQLSSSGKMFKFNLDVTPLMNPTE